MTAPNDHPHPPGSGDDDSPTGRRRRLRFWFPITVIALAVVAIVVLDRSEWWLRAYGQVLAVLVAVALIGGWFALSLPRRGITKAAALIAWIGLLVALGALAPQVVRVEGAAGSGLMELDWAWSDSGELTELPAASASAATSAAVDPAVAAASYPEFLGPQRDGRVPGPGPGQGFGRPDWTAEPPELLWEREIGLGWSGFTVANGRAITQEQRGEQEVVSCYDLLTGDVVWTHTNDARFSESMGGTGPRSNPTMVGDRVYAMGATGILDCLDLATGAMVWTREAVAPDQNIEWGKSCAPLVVDGLVVVTGGKEPGPALLAFSADDGTPAWSAGESASSYSSPVLATLAGQRQIIVVHADRIAGHAVADGTVLWEHEWPGPYPRVAQPIVVDGNRVLATAGYGYGALFIEVTPAGAEADAGSDSDAQAPSASASFTTSELWRSLRMKTKFSSAVVHDGFAYGLDEGRMAAMDLSDGSRAWRGEKLGYGQNLLAGDTILAQAENGDVVLVAADPTGYDEITRFTALEGKTWNPPALAGEFLLVRNAGHAACYRLRSGADPGAP